MSKLFDLTGMRFGRLVVLHRDFECKKDETRWICKCDCGAVKSINGISLKTGRTKSCGCLQAELVSKRCRIYEDSDKRLRSIWRGMKERCFRKENISYPLYGGRGITVCEEWAKSFMAFREWALKNGYAENLSIDRTDSNGNYCPENCRWVTAKEQSNNTRRNVFITYKEKTMTVSEWAEITGIKKETLADRKRRGWSDSDCIEIPVVKGNNQKTKHNN